MFKETTQPVIPHQHRLRGRGEHFPATMLMNSHNEQNDASGKTLQQATNMTPVAFIQYRLKGRNVG